MDAVLDLDLDFFVWPVAYGKPEDGPRLSSRACNRAASDDVVNFLERQCGLSATEPIPGRQVVNHDGAFDAWRDWIDRGILKVPFQVVHVDAHADLGMCDGGWCYLLTDVLRLPPERRTTPQRGADGMSASNYLAFAVATRWIARITFVYPAGFTNGPNDLLLYHFKDLDWRTSTLRLRHYDVPRDELDPDDVEGTREPTSYEPDVPFNLCREDHFRFKGFTHMVVAQSPAFTPAKADRLLPVIGRYFRPAGAKSGPLRNFDKQAATAPGRLSG